MSIDSIHWSEIVSVKIIGTPVGALGGDCEDGDGDGFCTPPGSDEDKVPVPQRLFPVEAFDHKPAWSDVEDIMDWEALGYSESPDDEDLYNEGAQFVEQWGFWQPCRDMRKAAYAFAGLEPGKPDPNVNLEDRNAFRMATDETRAKEGARYFMGRLVEGVRAKYRNGDSLYRAMRVDGDKEDEVLEAFQKGELVDIPLLAFADRRRQGPNEYLADRFGDDFLLEVEPGAAVVEGGHFDPFYDEADENANLLGLDDMIRQFDDEIEQIKADSPGELSEEDEDEIDRIEEARDNIAYALEKYRELPKDAGIDEIEDARNRVVNAMEEAGYDDGDVWRPRWAGEIIPEEDGDYFWDAMDNPGGSNVPQELISGGRFEVVDVIDDPDRRYSKIIKLRQIGVFDPQKQGAVVFAGGAATKEAKPKRKGLPKFVDFPTFDQPLAPPRKDKPRRPPKIGKPVRKARKKMRLNDVKWVDIRKVVVAQLSENAEVKARIPKIQTRPNPGKYTALKPGLAKPRNPMTQAIVGDPRDGDGDGKYSKFPGAPDETPMPFAPRQLPEGTNWYTVKLPGSKRSSPVLELEVQFPFRLEDKDLDTASLRPGVEHVAARVRFRNQEDRDYFSGILGDLGKLHGVDPNDDIAVFTISRDDLAKRGYPDGVRAVLDPSPVEVVSPAEAADMIYAALIVDNKVTRKEDEDLNLLHEFGHRMDLRVSGFTEPVPEYLSGYSHPAVDELFEAVANLPSHGERAEWVKTASVLARRPDFPEYFWSRQEVFARVYAQWAAIKMQRTDLIDYMREVTSSERKKNPTDSEPFQYFSPEDMEVLTPLMDAVMRERGLY